MPDEEPKKVETTEPTQQPKDEKPKADELPIGPDGKPFDPERAMATINKLREFEKEAEALRKKVDAYEQAEQERKEAEMSEMDKLKAERDRLHTELEQRRITDTKRRIAADVGLPDAFALRIQGDDEAAMKEDAEAMLASLPKEVKKITATTGNPGSGQPGKKTDAERKAELYGTSIDIFSPEWAAAHGGGVVFNSDKE